MKRDELIDKIADGIVLGSIPNCESCKEGIIVFNYKTGIYKCTGY